MRVITGSARGLRLNTLEGESVRPTSEKTKEAIFSAIQFDIEGRSVLDLFAGSGQLGIEALSRGAARAVFTDSSADAIEIIKQNVKKAGFDKQSVVSKIDYEQFLKGTKEVFDIAFIDPPYNAGFIQKALDGTSNIMSEHGIIICEHSADISVPSEINGFTIYREYKYGKLITVTIYKKER